VQPINSTEVRKLFAFSREKKIPLTFRAGGTSLSGQAITDGILVDIGRNFRSASVEQEGQLLRVQPGLIGAQANAMLKKYASKIGPDPASITAARLGRHSLQQRQRHVAAASRRMLITRCAP